jgi:hypothetical protein
LFLLLPFQILLDQQLQWIPDWHLVLQEQLQELEHFALAQHPVLLNLEKLIAVHFEHLLFVP